MEISWYKRHYMAVTFGAAFLGALLSYSGLPMVQLIAFILSKLFINMLELMSLPLIFLSIVSTISGMDSVENMKILGKKVVSYTLLTTILSAAVGLALYVIINPASSMVGMEVVTQSENALSESYFEFLLRMIPSNMIKMFSENGNVIAVVLFAVAVGIATLQVSIDHKKTLSALFQSFFALVLQLTQGIILLLPLGVFGFVYQLFDALLLGKHEFSSLFWYSITIVLANIIQGCVVLPLLLTYKGIDPKTYFKKVSSALTMAFLSKSSSATLSVSIDCAINKARISEKIASFGLPLCTTINMNGCAAFMLITVFFVAGSHGIVFPLSHMILWIFIVTIAAIGNAGIPMGCYFLTSAFLASMNIPLYVLGIILPLYTFFDMVETALNVWSDLVVVAIIDKES